MNPDPLEQLLREADSAARRPPAQAELAARIRRLDLRQRRIARLALVSAAASVLLLAGVGLRAWYGGQPPAPTGESQAKAGGAGQTRLESTEEIFARAAGLTEEADRMSGVLAFDPAARELDRRIGRFQALLWEVEVASPLQRREEEAAKALYLAAARLEYELHDRAAAREAYRCVVRQFPRSISAQLARQSLPRLEKAEGESS